MSLVVTTLVFLSMGIIEFGRMLMIANVITSATRDAARVAAVSPRTGGTCPGAFSNAATIQGVVTTQLQSVGLNSGVTVTPTATTQSGLNVVMVRTVVTVPYLFNLPGVGTSLAVDRSITFRDEVC